MVCDTLGRNSGEDIRYTWLICCGSFMSGVFHVPEELWSSGGLLTVCDTVGGSRG